MQTSNESTEDYHYQLEDIKPTYQSGHNCKIVAIACIDDYWSRRLKFPKIYVHKNKRGVYSNIPEEKISIRQIAKTHGSIQGELLEIEQLNEILKEIGYNSKTVDCAGDIEIFKGTIKKSLELGQPLICFFAVDRDTSQPTSVYDDNEHACVVSGYLESDGASFTRVIHWGQELWFPTEELFNSAMVLPQTRLPENYYRVDNRVLKYQKSPDGSFTYNSIQTSTPKESTGFKAKLIVVDSPKITSEFRGKLFSPTPNNFKVNKILPRTATKTLTALACMSIVPLVTLIIGACCNVSPASIGLWLAMGCCSANPAIIAICVAAVIVIATAGFIGYNLFSKENSDTYEEPKQLQV
ncbi:MAG: hypothetical protein P1U74_05585 [Legionellaceae bacterium]|nr:hypothetical protein [Legionellaceae bacterium]